MRRGPAPDAPTVVGHGPDGGRLILSCEQTRMLIQIHRIGLVMPMQAQGGDLEEGHSKNQRDEDSDEKEHRTEQHCE